MPRIDFTDPALAEYREQTEVVEAYNREMTCRELAGENVDWCEEKHSFTFKGVALDFDDPDVCMSCMKEHGFTDVLDLGFSYEEHDEYDCAICGVRLTDDNAY